MHALFSEAIPPSVPLQPVQAATGVFSLVWLLIALPVLGAVVLLLGGKRTNKWGPIFGVLVVWAAFAVAAAQLVALLQQPSEQRSYGQTLWTWVDSGVFNVNIGFQLDQLSMTFVLLITFVGGLIHLYSLGYMEHDAHKRRFFGYLNLFVASMLLLVLANSYVLVYVGWEGVGLASYLLIGFWNERRDYATAGNKAFIMNRVGDLGMSVAIMVMFATFGTSNFTGVFSGAGDASGNVMLAMGLLLTLAAIGKSAQMPLQAWLLDAMAGPTPVSALIHAATMVTAGVYLIVRSGPVFDQSATALTVVAIIGTATILFGAFIATAQDDFKRVLAGSTMSQIGYMMLAAGLGPAGAAYGIFHLLVHGFFKANLFLGAGSVMHAMNDRLDMRRFGGLRKAMPLTFITFLAGYLAIIGVPPFDGFFSKDKIIEAAFGQNVWYGLLAVLGAGVTAYYMTRLVVMTFLGKPRWHDDDHPHDPGPTMWVPLVLLGLLSTVAGIYLAWGNRFVDWLAPVTGTAAEPTFAVPTGVVTAGILAVVLVGAALGYWQFTRQPVPFTAPVAPAVTVAARHDFYEDAFNESLFERPGQWLTRVLVFFDNRVIDGVVNGLAAGIGGSSSRIRRWQTGFVRSYALTIFGGAAVIVLALLLVRL